VDIPATTEFEEFGFLGISGQLLPVVKAEEWDFQKQAKTHGLTSSLILIDSQGG
jgi:hypothetical protein